MLKLFYLLLVRCGGVGPIHLEIITFFICFLDYQGSLWNWSRRNTWSRLRPSCLHLGQRQHRTLSFELFKLNQSPPRVSMLPSWSQSLFYNGHDVPQRLCKGRCHVNHPQLVTLLKSPLLTVDSDNAFVLFPPCFNLIGKKIPEELCLSPPTALAHQSQSLSEDKINLKFHVYNQKIERIILQNQGKQLLWLNL